MQLAAALDLFLQVLERGNASLEFVGLAGLRLQGALRGIPFRSGGRQGFFKRRQLLFALGGLKLAPRQFVALAGDSLFVGTIQAVLLHTQAVTARHQRFQRTLRIALMHTLDLQLLLGLHDFRAGRGEFFLGAARGRLGIRKTLGMLGSNGAAFLGPDAGRLGLGGPVNHVSLGLALLLGPGFVLSGQLGQLA